MNKGKIADISQSCRYFLNCSNIRLISSEYRESFNGQRESEIIMFNKFENYSNFLPPANNFVLQTNR